VTAHALDSLQFVPGDETWTKLRKKALSDLYWFTGVVLNYGDRVGMTEGVHRLMCRFVEKKLGVPELDQAPYRKVEMPRTTGKSTLITQGYAIQRICADRNIAILICNENVTNAAAFLGEIKAQFENNELLRALFPEVIPPDLTKTTWKEDEMVVARSQDRKESTVTAVGVGGTKTGMHPDLIIVDDMLSREAAENARIGGDAMAKINRWIAQLMPLLNPWAKPFPETIFIGTRWFHGDSYEWLEEAFGYGESERTWSVSIPLPSGEKQVIPVMRRGDIAIFRRSAIENGRTIWPENPSFSLEALSKFRITDPALFAANMMNKPSDDVTATFKESWLKYYDWLDPKTLHYINAAGAKKTVGLQDMDIQVFVDPGGFKTAVRSSDRARAAIMVTGQVAQDILLIDGYFDNATFLHAIDKILEFVIRYKPRRVYVEIAGQQLAFYELLRRIAKERGVTVSLDTVEPEGRNKDARILGLEPYFQRGQIWIGRGAIFMEFRQQYSEWPRSRRRDALDILAYGPEKWRQQGPTQQSHQQRQEQERQTLRLRIGRR
jgi:hypothetical protein